MIIDLYLAIQKNTNYSKYFIEIYFKQIIMKRSTRILLLIGLFFMMTIWAYQFMDLFTVLIPYALIILLLGLNAGYTILSSIIKLK